MALRSILALGLRATPQLAVAATTYTDTVGAAGHSAPLTNLRSIFFGRCLTYGARAAGKLALTF
jgi:hypothetical protein